MLEKKNENNKNYCNMLEDPVGELLIRLTIPMIIGFTAIMSFSLVDTYFVGKLGSQDLAALCFTFPLKFLFGNLLISIGVATGATLSQQVGRGESKQILSEVVTSMLLFSLFLVSILAATTLLLFKPIFYFLGSSPEILLKVKEYFFPWLLSTFFIAIVSVGNHVMRSLGETKFPSMVMILATVINILFDLLLIFGWGSFQGLGIKGAAIASIIAWSLTSLIVWRALSKKEKLIDVNVIREVRFIKVWKKNLPSTLPIMGSNLMAPFAVAVMTAFLGRHGSENVAAFGVVAKIEPFAMIVIIALSTVLPPFIGQHAGAGKWERIRKALFYVVTFSLLWEGLVFLLLIANASPLAKAFSTDPVVIEKIIDFLWVISPSYGCLAIFILIVSALTAVNKAIYSAGLQGMRTFGINIPLVYGGSLYFGSFGIFCAASLSNLLSVIPALFSMRKFFFWKKKLPS